MDRRKIERINALARKQRAGELTPEERAEQAQLRQEYLAEWRRGTTAMLESVVIQRPDGSREKLHKKDEQN